MDMNVKCFVSIQAFLQILIYLFFQIIRFMLHYDNEGYQKNPHTQIAVFWNLQKIACMLYRIDSNTFLILTVSTLNPNIIFQIIPIIINLHS